MKNVELKIKKNKIIAILQPDGVEIGVVSTSVSEATLRSFKCDMLSIKDKLSAALSDAKISPESTVEPQIHVPVAAEVVEEPKVQQLELTAPDATVNGTSEETKTAERSDTTAQDAANKESPFIRWRSRTALKGVSADETLDENFYRVLLGETLNGKSTLTRRYNNERSPDQISFYVRDLMGVGKVYIRRSAAKAKDDLPTTVAKFLLDNKIIDKTKYSTVVTFMRDCVDRLLTTEPPAKGSGLVSMKFLPTVEAVVTPPNLEGLNLLRTAVVQRRRKSSVVPDAMYLKFMDLAAYTSIGNGCNVRLDALASRLRICEPGLPSMVVLTEFLGYVVQTIRDQTPKPRLGGSASRLDINVLIDEFLKANLEGATGAEKVSSTTTKKELPEANLCGTTTPVTVCGFTSEKAISIKDSIPKGSAMAVQHWPWFFDSEGRFDFITLKVNEQGTFLSVTKRGKHKNKRHEVLIDRTYRSIRSAIQVAYLAGIMGTSFDQFPAVKDELDRAIDLTTEAILVDLNVTAPDVVGVAGTNSKRNNSEFDRMDFTDCDSRYIIDSVSYPSGKLRLAWVNRSPSDGLQWCVRADTQGVGPYVNARRSRYGQMDPEIEATNIANEIIKKTNITDSAAMGYILSALKCEVSAVKSGRIK